MNRAGDNRNREAAELKIGFIGLGAMGGRLAARLAGVGELTVFDTSQRAMEPFTGRASLGCEHRARSAPDADVVGVCVRTDAPGRRLRRTRCCRS